MGLRWVLGVVSHSSYLWGYLGRPTGGIWGRHKLRHPRACSSECTMTCKLAGDRVCAGQDSLGHNVAVSKAG